MAEPRKIVRQIQQLEIYLNSLVSSLTRGELPVNLKPVTQIFDDTIVSIPPILNLPIERFIEIYNDIPHLFTAYAIDVTLSEDSYFQQNNYITFQRFSRGNYWILPMKESEDNAWLVPNPLKSIALNLAKSLEYSFERDFIATTDDNSFILVTPALVQRLPIIEPLSWKLLERGKISKSHQSIEQDKGITLLIAEIQSNLSAQIELTMAKYDLLYREEYNKMVGWMIDADIELHEFKSRSNYNKDRLIGRLDRQRDDIDRLQKQVDRVLLNNITEDRNSITTATLVANEQGSSQQSETIGSTQLQTRIVCDYYHDSSNFDNIYHPKIATITKETINNNWTSEQKVLILTEAERGNYWILESEGICYVVPYYGKYFNQHSYQTLSTIFECENYTPDYNNIQLLAAAIATKESVTNPQTWRIQTQGKLFFK
jgi:BMFP domain-containing protein YqiC